MEITEEEIRNIKKTTETVALKIFDSSNDFDKKEIRIFEANPLKYLIQNGLSESTRNKLRSNGVVFQEFKNSLRDYLRRIRKRLIEHIDKCFACVIGLLILLAIIFAGATIQIPVGLDLIKLLSNVLLTYFGASFFINGIISKISDLLKATGIPNLSANNLAQFLCYSQEFVKNRE
jgi:hypothetical protein